MTFVRRYRLETTPDRAPALIAAMRELLTAMADISGFAAGEIMQVAGEEGVWFLDERWVDQAAHAASDPHLPKAKLKALMGALSAPPQKADLVVL